MSALPPKADIGTGPRITFGAPAPAVHRNPPRLVAGGMYGPKSDARLLQVRGWNVCRFHGAGGGAPKGGSFALRPNVRQLLIEGTEEVGLRIFAPFDIPESEDAQSLPIIDLLNGMPVGRLGAKSQKPILPWFD